MPVDFKGHRVCGHDYATCRESRHATTLGREPQDLSLNFLIFQVKIVKIVFRLFVCMMWARSEDENLSWVLFVFFGRIAAGERCWVNVA